MCQLISASAQATRQLASRLAAHLQDGDVLLLSGDLGAGKSEFCRGLAAGLGIQGAVPSPSFTILNLYTQGTLPFKHFDWYRINSPEELYESGLDEQLSGAGVTAIEWYERAPELLPDTCLEIRLQAVEGQADKRYILFVPHGDFRPLPYNDLSARKEDSP